MNISHDGRSEHRSGLWRLLKSDAALLRWLGLAGVIVVGWIGALIARRTGVEIEVWRPPILGASVAIVASVALGAPTGASDWVHAVGGSVALVTLWICGLVAVGQSGALASLAGPLLTITLLIAAAALIIAWMLMYARGPCEPRTGLALGACVALGITFQSMSGYVLPAAWLLGLVIGALASGSGLGTPLWGVASAVAIWAMLVLPGQLYWGALIFGIEILLSWRRRPRWMVADALLLAAWLLSGLLSSPDLVRWALALMAAVMLLGEGRYSLGSPEPADASE
jgi:hypothetical protein